MPSCSIYVLWLVKFGKATATAQAVKYLCELRLLSEKYGCYAAGLITMGQSSGEEKGLKKM